MRERHNNRPQPPARHQPRADVHREVPRALLLAAREDPRVHGHRRRDRRLPRTVLPVLVAYVSWIIV